MKFNPDIELNRGEQAALTSIVGQPGFQTLLTIGRSCVDGFVVDWLNQEEDKDILRAHRYAKVASQFWTMFIDRINNTVIEYTHSIPSEKPIESAENIDIGEYTNIDDNYTIEEIV